jgi:hypothetical protein
MDEEEVIAGGDIAREDVVDALEDTDNEDALSLVTEYYVQVNGKDDAIATKIRNARKCAELIFKAKRFEEVNIWLDEIATIISDEYGPDSEEYMAFTEDEELETLRMNASDRSLGDEEEEDDYNDDDE